VVLASGFLGGTVTLILVLAVVFPFSFELTDAFVMPTGAICSIASNATMALMYFFIAI
jgi:hypothetical protein